MKTILLLAGLLLLSLSCISKSQSPATNQCPMKCEGDKFYEESGTCPVCGMKLTSVAASGQVKVVGAMSDVMHKNQLSGVIRLDTIPNREHLFGLGPVEYLTGEILIDGGKTLVSTVASDGSIKIEESPAVKAPFFVYARVEQWMEKTLPEDVQTLDGLSTFLDESTRDHERPFVFRLTAQLKEGDIHIVNLAKGSTVHSREEAHKGQQSYRLENEDVELIGFFSTKHQGVFTHHDSYVHIHLVSADGKKMGHLDGMTIKKGSAKLYLSAN